MAVSSLKISINPVPRVAFMNYEFRLNLQVRAYECDVGGVVNNSVYLQYLEHAKCESLGAMNTSYEEMINGGLSFVVSKLNIDFKYSLKYGDAFWVGINTRRPSNYHLEGDQDIYRSDGKLILLSQVVVVCMKNQEICKLPPQIIDCYPLYTKRASFFQNK